MNIKEAIAYWKLDMLGSEEIPKVAVSALESGMDSECLRELASETELEMSNLGPLFKQCIKSLKINIPTEQEAVYEIARYLSKKIISKELTPYEGAEKILDAYYQVDNTDEIDSLLVFSGLTSQINDFGDKVNIDFYGQEHCLRVQKETEQEIIKEANNLLNDGK